MKYDSLRFYFNSPMCYNNTMETKHTYQNTNAKIFLEIDPVLTEDFAGYAVYTYDLDTGEYLTRDFFQTKDEAVEYVEWAIR